MITLSNLPKTVAKTQRVGRGNGSNRGKNAGKGHKGQLKRAGKMRVGFVGGQKSLASQQPKLRGYNFNSTNRHTAELTISRIDQILENGDTVNLETLFTRGLISDKIKDVKIINSGSLTKNIKFVVTPEIRYTASLQALVK